MSLLDIENSLCFLGGIHMLAVVDTSNYWFQLIYFSLKKIKLLTDKHNNTIIFERSHSYIFNSKMYKEFVYYCNVVTFKPCLDA